MKIFTFLMMAFFGSSSFVLANWQDLSVWKRNQMTENLIVGQVKTIAFREEQDQLIVKIKMQNGLIETVKMCGEGVQSARNQIFDNSKLALLTHAMSKGLDVSLSYASQYDRCIDEVSLAQIKNGGTLKEASAIQTVREI